MEKLELKHISPYLPYGLSCEILNYKSDYVGEKYGVITGYYFLAGEPHYMFKNKDFAGKDSSLIKPILRPLFDLTKEINNKGEVFVPIDRIRETYGVKLEYDVDCGVWYPTYLGRSENLFHGIYPIQQVLFEWHFDVLDLHSQNLCIYFDTKK